MIYKGRVKNGMVVLDGDVRLPDGSEVNVQPVESQPVEEEGDREVPPLYDRMKPFIAAIKGMPPDLAENHDHYIHGTSKNQ